MAFLSQKVSHRVYAKCFSLAPPDISNLGFFLLEQPFRRTQFATFNKLMRNVTKQQLPQDGAPAAIVLNKTPSNATKSSP